MSHWYCKKCRSSKEPTKVTYEENCADCGFPVVFVDKVRGILFSKLEGEYYELTGEKPYHRAARFDEEWGAMETVASMDYVKFLVDVIKNSPKEV